jgi:hypothetical protein
MSRVETIEKDVRQLSPRELADFRAWFHEFDAAEWDLQFAEDIKTGKLDSLVQGALEEHQAGKTKNI